MKNVKVIGWASLLFLLQLTSCTEDRIDPISTTILPDPVLLVESSLNGQVIDENNLPLAAVSIKINDTEIMTDENGFFAFDKINMNKNGTHVTANKFGYFFNSKMVNPTLGNNSFVLFQMLEKINLGNFNSTEGGAFSTSDGARVTFGANSIMLENETEYTGTVEVSAKWLDPTHELISARMPGDLRAIDSEESLVQLATYGMLVVELEAPNGTPLQISEGNTATITLPVPADIINQAPSTIPLWSFNEGTGYWEEESTATLQEDKYVGEVSHFSFWNCNVPFPVVEFEARVISTNGIPIPNILVFISNDNIGIAGAFTDSDGKVYGKVPKDEDLTITVRDQCFQTTYTSEIGPYSNTVVLDPIEISEIIQSSFSGTLLKCNGSPVENGYAYIDGDIYDQFLPIDENGLFEQTALLCDDSNIELIGYDLDVPSASDPLSLTIPEGSGNVDIGEIQVCNTITEMIRVIIPDLSYDENFLFYEAIPNVDSIMFLAESNSSNLYLIIASDPLQTGVVSIGRFTINLFYNDPNSQNYSLLCNGSPEFEACTSNFDIVSNEGSGGIFEGSLTGDFADNYSESDTYEVTVEINIILD